MISVPYNGRFDELDQRDIQNVQGLLYLTITETIFLFIYAVFITFPSEVPILLRETANGLYSPLPYYLSKMIFWVSSNINKTTDSPVLSLISFQFLAGSYHSLLLVQLECTKKKWISNTIVLV